MKRINTRAVGSCYEELAACYLIRHGYEILTRNFRSGRYAEIDIVARDPDGVIVFAEVKYRSGRGSGSSLSAVNRRKQQRISGAALFFLKVNDLGVDVPCRFDVLGIEGEKEIIHIKNAFEYAGRS